LEPVAIGIGEPQLAYTGSRQTWHALRHHAAWREWERTRDLRRVQALLGHRSQATTSRYLQLDDRERDELVREATAELCY
jgi:site-specific recombinase XerD